MLVCSGNLDGQQRLIVKGRFLPKGFENVIRRYVNECDLLPFPLGRMKSFSDLYSPRTLLTMMFCALMALVT